MNLKPRAIILLAIDAFGGKVDGKTLLQKRLYFIEVLLAKNLGLNFDAYYYGPYSALINSELSTLKLQRQIREDESTYGFSNESGFEIRRVQYYLTDEGKAGVEWLRRNYSEEAEHVMQAARQVVAAGNLDYMDMSFAAKSHWILCHARRRLSEAEIANEAQKFGWKVKQDQVHRGIEFLQTLRLSPAA